MVKKYPRYKDSGIAWIGEIPEGWNLMRLQFCLQEIKEQNAPIKSKQVLSLVKDKGVMLYEEKGNLGNVAKEDISEYKLAYPNTLILNSMNILIGSVGISKYFGCVSPVYYVFKETDQSDLRFINYLFTTRELQKQLRRYANGIMEIRLRVSAQDIFKRKIALPKKNEQKAIADYLDEKCGAIDKTIETEEKVIEKLKEYKQSLITETVTKGLDKSAPMKDSGLPWIGQIPQHWEVAKLKNLFSFGKGLGITKEDLTESGIPVISYGQIHSKKNAGTYISEELMQFVPEKYLKDGTQSLVNKGDFIFADTSEDVEGAGNCVFIDKKMTLFAGYHSVILRNRTNFILGRYLSYLFNSLEWRTQIQAKVTGIKVYSISKKILKELTVLIPQQDEQQAIAEYLDGKCAEINKIIADKEQVIGKLTEYKKSLIYECVTGKRMVA